MSAIVALRRVPAVIAVLVVVLIAVVIAPVVISMLMVVVLYSGSTNPLWFAHGDIAKNGFHSDNRSIFGKAVTRVGYCDIAAKCYSQRCCNSQCGFDQAFFGWCFCLAILAVFAMHLLAPGPLMSELILMQWH